ncbi:unnamed protein product [Clonostachys rosea f. rosea IK726]|uniref:Uncharacterized protein n=1 Tax=Clonostachys rosea f. rosea IK726 TaxID=1349383 RepID=A0ACA9UV37_BIOOC|nr:unnamed protein product [Clonostachys rosea f. rosea IK726]
MSYTILLSGDRANFTTVSFDANQKKLAVTANYPSPFNASWVEPSSSLGPIDRLIGLSEGIESGSLYTFEIDHQQKTCKITSLQTTLGAPAHFITLHDKSALALGTYLGGSVALYHISITEPTGLLFADTPRTEIFPEFPYKALGHGPNEGRQRQCHVHQVLEDKRGFLYAPDLGADRVWILKRDQMKLDRCGWLQCLPGTGARHAVFGPKEKIMYVIGELSHTVAAFDLSTSPEENIQPIDGFVHNIIPPNVPLGYHSMMDSSELCAHPKIPNILYASNRWERHIRERQSDLKTVPEVPDGDSIAILLLSADGRKLEEMKHVKTKVDTIRGMRLSDDGKYVVVLGQEGGGIEVYSINGERGDIWNLVASLDDGLEGGIKHAVWL